MGKLAYAPAGPAPTGPDDLPNFIRPFFGEDGAKVLRERVGLVFHHGSDHGGRGSTQSGGALDGQQAKHGYQAPNETLARLRLRPTSRESRRADLELGCW